MEVHPAFGKPDALIACLEQTGFEWAIRTMDLRVVEAPPLEAFYLHAWQTA